MTAASVTVKPTVSSNVVGLTSENLKAALSPSCHDTGDPLTTIARPSSVEFHDCTFIQGEGLRRSHQWSHLQFAAARGHRPALCQMDQIAPPVARNYRRTGGLRIKLQCCDTAGQFSTKGCGRTVTGACRVTSAELSRSEVAGSSASIGGASGPRRQLRRQ